MTGANMRVEKADKEAAAWHERLGTTSVATQTIEDFFTWRALPGNADAYRRVQRVWTESGRASADPVLAQALEEARLRAARRRLVRGRRPLMIGSVVAVAGAVCLAVSGTFWWQGRGLYSTDVGQQRVVELADGSNVKMDTGSRIRVRLERGMRRVDLMEGQALFTVAHDATRPFVVQAGDTEVVAVGTVFDVQRRGADVDVTLVSGIVDVASASVPARKTRMNAGQQTRVSSGDVRTRAVDTKSATAWTQGRLIFEDVPLANAVAEINRYLPEKIFIDDATLNAAPINGVFRTGDRDAFVAAASDALGLVASSGAGGSVRLSRRPDLSSRPPG